MIKRKNVKRQVRTRQVVAKSFSKLEQVTHGGK